MTTEFRGNQDLTMGSFAKRVYPELAKSHLLAYNSIRTLWHFSYPGWDQHGTPGYFQIDRVFRPDLKDTWPEDGRPYTEIEAISKERRAAMYEESFARPLREKWPDAPQRLLAYNLALMIRHYHEDAQAAGVGRSTMGDLATYVFRTAQTWQEEEQLAEQGEELKQVIVQISHAKLPQLGAQLVGSGVWSAASRGALVAAGVINNFANPLNWALTFAKMSVRPVAAAYMQAKARLSDIVVYGEHGADGPGWFVVSPDNSEYLARLLDFAQYYSGLGSQHKARDKNGYILDFPQFMDPQFRELLALAIHIQSPMSDFRHRDKNAAMMQWVMSERVRQITGS